MQQQRSRATRYALGGLLSSSRRGPLPSEATHLFVSSRYQAIIRCTTCWSNFRTSSSLQNTVRRSILDNEHWSLDVVIPLVLGVGAMYATAEWNPPVYALERSIKYYAPSGVLFNRLWNSLEKTTTQQEDNSYHYTAAVPTFLIQKETARALGLLAKDESAAVRMVADGGLDKLLQILNRLDACTGKQTEKVIELKKMIIHVISHLARHNDNKFELLECTEWMKRLKDWTGDSALETPATAKHIAHTYRALSTHLTKSAKATQLLMQSNCMEALAKLAKKRPGLPKTKQCIAKCILELAKNDQLKRKIIDSNGLQMLKDLCVKNKKDIKLQKKIAKAIVHLAQSEENMLDIVNGGWLEIIKWWASLDDKKLRLMTATALEELIQNEEVAQRILEAMGYDWLLALANMVDIDVLRCAQRMFDNLRQKGMMVDWAKETDTIADKGILIDDDFNLVELTEKRT